MFTNIRKAINNIKMTKENIKRKNLAATITLITELIKVLTLILFLGVVNSTFAKTMFIFSIIATSISIFILFNDDYKKLYKYCVLDLSSIVFLLSNIIGGILIEKIIINVDKKLIKESFKKEKTKKLPIILYHNKIVYLYLFLSIMIAYQYLYINEMFFYTFNIIFLILFFKNDIINNIKDFKNNKMKYICTIINLFIIMSILSSILFTITGIIVGGESTNQEILNQNIISTALLGILYAPIAEELLFRGCLRKLIKNDLAFILISGISFGAWHVIGFEQSLIQYLYIIPYSAMGILLSYAYTKYNNLTTNISVHWLNNFIATIINFI